MIVHDVWTVALVDKYGDFAPHHFTHECDARLSIDSTWSAVGGAVVQDDGTITHKGTGVGRLYRGEIVIHDRPTRF